MKKHRADTFRYRPCSLVVLSWRNQRVPEGTRDLPAAATATAATAAAAATTATEAAAATAAAATTEAAAATTAAAAAATLTRTSLVDGEVATIDVLAVERSDRSVAFLSRGELDETEATGATGFAIHDEGRAGDVAVSREELAKLILSGLEREITDVKLHALHLEPEAVYDSGA